MLSRVNWYIALRRSKTKIAPLFFRSFKSCLSLKVWSCSNRVTIGGRGRSFTQFLYKVRVTKIALLFFRSFKSCLSLKVWSCSNRVTVGRRGRSFTQFLYKVRVTTPRMELCLSVCLFFFSRLKLSRKRQKRTVICT